MAPHLEKALHALKGLPHVIDVRNMGLLGAVELEPIPDKPTARALDVFGRCFDDGLLLRTTGDTIAITPSLIVETDQIDRIADTLGRALRAAA